MTIENLKKVTNKTRYSFALIQAETNHILKCAEIGCWIGENAEDMLTVDPLMTLDLIDAYTNIGYTEDKSQGSGEEVKEKAWKRLSKFSDRIKFVYKQSEEAYKNYPDEHFDYIYIDGDHSYYGAYRDMKIWWSKLKKGGLFAGHDVGMPSVSKAFIDFLLDIGRMGDGKKLEGGGVSEWWIFR